LSYAPIVIPYSWNIIAARLSLSRYVQPYLNRPFLSLSITGSPYCQHIKKPSILQ